MLHIYVCNNMYIKIKFQMELKEKYLQIRLWASKNEKAYNKIDQNKRMCEMKTWNYWTSSDIYIGNN